MLVDRVYKVERTINQYETMQNKLNQFKRLENMEKKIKACNKELKELVNIKTALNTLKIESIHFVDTTERSIEGIHNKLDENIEYASDMVSDLITELKKHNSEMKVVWKEYFSSQYLNILGTLNLLKKVSDNMEIIKLYASIEAIGNKWPILEKDIERLEGLNVESKKIIDELEINEHIQNFLYLTLNNKATIKDLDPEILKWLKDTNTVGNILLSFKR